MTHPRQVWHKGKKGYLFNAFALAKVWRARLLEAINQDEQMWLPNNLPTKWVVDCRCAGYGLPALQYLSRYLYRGVLPDKDIIRITDTEVTFRYLDSQTNARKTRTLPILKFLWLVLQHVLPKGPAAGQGLWVPEGECQTDTVQNPVAAPGAVLLYPPCRATCKK